MEHRKQAISTIAAADGTTVISSGTYSSGTITGTYTNSTYTVSPDAVIHDTFMGNRIYTERKQATETVERRYFADGLEYRKADEGAPKLRGYALKFGVSYNMGWFTEEVDRRALDRADLSDVRVLLNHDPNQILGRTTAGTARVGVDDTGLWYEVDLPDSPNGQNARVAVERGDVTQSSWGFMLRVDDKGNGDKWEKRNGKEHRILTDIRMVFDASPVTFPANPDTSVAKRSLELYTESADPGDEQEERAIQQDIETQIEIALLERQFFTQTI